MQEFFDDRFKVLKALKNAKIQIGVFEEYGTQSMAYIMYDTEGNEIGKETATLRDIMYFTEKGTISIPAYRILERLEERIRELIPPYMNRAVEIVMTEDGTVEDVRKELQKFADYVNMHVINTVIDGVVASQNFVENILTDEEKQSTRAVFDLKSLKKFIKCKFFLEI